MLLTLKRTVWHRRCLEILFLIFTAIRICIFISQYFFTSVPEYQQFNDPIDSRELRKNLLKKHLQCYDQPLQFERLQYGEYWLLKNFIKGKLSICMGCSESITYTTNEDFTFIENLETVVTRWMGPVSFAIFAPGYDFNSTLDSILYALHCLPFSRLIRDYVTFHIYFPNKHMPNIQNIPLSEEEALEWPYDCQLMKAPYEEIDRAHMYKNKKNLTYPINVGRNIARKAANTYFIFACDIELYPSLNFIEQFLTMAANNISLVMYNEDFEEKPRVFPLPVFELDESVGSKLPETKKELLHLLKIKKAIPFHMNVCRSCHLVPGQDIWMSANHTDDMQVIKVGKRYDKFAMWEPFYISDNREPDFDERVTWEGQSNKRIQNYAMCLLDYEYHILNPGFLVHAPGIKKFDPKSKRRHFVPPMNRLIANKIKPEYQILYGENKKCKV